MFQLDVSSFFMLGLLVTLGFAATTVLMADPQRLPLMVRKGLEGRLGADRLREVEQLQAAWEKRILSETQINALRVLGLIAGVLVAVLLISVGVLIEYALILGAILACIGWIYPTAKFQEGVSKQAITQAEEYAMGFTLFLRQEVALGIPIELAIMHYVDTKRNPLADLLAGVPSGTGTDPIAGVAEIALRSGSEILMPIASALKSISKASDPRSVLESMELRTRSRLIARIRKENRAKQMRVLVTVVGLMLLGILAIILVPIMLNLLAIPMFSGG